MKKCQFFGREKKIIFGFGMKSVATSSGGFLFRNIETFSWNIRHFIKEKQLLKCTGKNSESQNKKSNIFGNTANELI